MTIEDTLDNFGEWAHGGDIGGVVAEWAAAGFDANDVAAWLDARCVYAEAALELQAAGLTPNDAMRKWDAPVGGYTDTVAYIYCNGDCTIEQAQAAVADDDDAYALCAAFRSIAESMVAEFKQGREVN